MKRSMNIYFSLLLVGSISAQETVMKLSLDSCRALAIHNNKELQMADTKRRAAWYERKATFTKYLPRVSATGAYLHTDREISLLSDGQKDRLGNLGTSVGLLAPELQSFSSALDGIGSGLVEALHTDTRNMGSIAVMLTQPIYMGGKITAYNHITRYAEQIAVRQHDLALQKVIVEVDEAYWQIVSLQNKRKLAESFLQLVEKLDNDVQQMISEGVATKADGLSVKVKVNEAQVALIQVENGLSLSRMLLCQLCGLELNSPITLLDEENSVVPMPDVATKADVQTAFAHRPELDVLSLSTDIYREKVRLARAEFMPTVALTGGWLGSNPSVFNSFERKFKGLWNVGVMINIPIVTWGERCYKVKAARAEEKLTHYHLEETREKVELQVSQSQQKLVEANERLHTAARSRDEADENLRYATLGMQEGVIPVSGVLEAQTAWLSAHSQYVTAQIDLRLAELYLRKSLGTLK
ncbi:MAG: TolC family protein [Bacteroidaceae bacterium]